MVEKKTKEFRAKIARVCSIAAKQASQATDETEPHVEPFTNKIKYVLDTAVDLARELKATAKTTKFLAGIAYAFEGHPQKIALDKRRAASKEGGRPNEANRNGILVRRWRALLKDPARAHKLLPGEKLPDGKTRQINLSSKTPNKLKAYAGRADVVVPGQCQDSTLKIDTTLQPDAARKAINKGLKDQGFGPSGV